ncbi:hypothetical protein Taro_023680 [Colocasia esculenta]|uniref:CSC1/OSCA1-like N-terminal transmembrane domain-containing protein n=1 Tax=Colocasia esculenta TaxID=4460 RepID=A0A843VC62_COLES|nr:hypothetical protein [Colocasia esculenta]
MIISALFTSVGINLGLCVLFFALYSVLRKQPGNVRVYASRLVVEGKAQQMAPFDIERLLPSAGWMRNAWQPSEDDLLSVAGLDAVVFMRIFIFSINTKIFNFMETQASETRVWRIGPDRPDSGGSHRITRNPMRGPGRCARILLSRRIEPDAPRYLKGVGRCAAKGTVLRVVDGDRRPSIGLVYAKLEAAKKKIREVSPRHAHLVLDVVNDRWDRQMSRDLCMAAYYLHPAYHYAHELAYEDDLTTAFTRVIERLSRSPVQAADAIDEASLGLSSSIQTNT